MNKKQIIIEQFDAWAKTFDKGFWGFYFRLCHKRVYSFLKSNLPRKSTFFDIGCGNGDMLNQISKYFNGKKIGLDISSKMIEYAIKKNYDRKVNFINSSIEEVNLGSQKFDVIICMNSFHHYSGHNKIVKKIFNHLNNGGLFILLDPITDRGIRKFWVYFLSKIFKEDDVKYFSKQDLNKIVLSEGFSIKEQRSFMLLDYLSVYRKDL